MAHKKFPDDLVLYPDELLESVSSPCIVFGDELQNLFQRMISVMEECNGVGISAIQIGVPSRALVVSWGGDTICMANPTITDSSEDTDYRNEGCLSIPYVTVPVHRSTEITVQYDDIDGQQHTTVFNGITARIIQHEVDHLNGETMFDQVSEFSASEAIKKYNKRRRKHG
jgi:peptide deformylase